MIHNENRDSRRYTLLRLHTYIEIREKIMVEAVRDIGGWNNEKLHQLMQCLDESIDGEIQKLGGEKGG